MDGGELDPRLAGARLEDINEASPLFGRIEGIVVAEVAPGSAASESGLLPNDIIVSLNRRPVADIATLKQRWRQGGRMLLHIRRGGGALFLLFQ